jgi:signal transduction histidine kinase
MEFFRELFANNFMPHGHCYFWKPDVLWTNVIGDGLTALSYLIIPIALYYVVKRRRDIRFKGIFVLFAAFILLCGTTHIFSIISVWDPLYRLEGLIKVITGLVSLITAVALILLMPKILALPSPRQLKDANKELKSKTETLESQNKLLENFAYATSHDFREPVRSIAMFSQLLVKKHKDTLPPDDVELLEFINTESARMYSLTGSIMNISFLETDSYELHKVSLTSAVENALKILQHLITRTQATIKVGELPDVIGNVELLEMLFENLISNSIHFRSDRLPVVTIEAAVSDNICTITISDNGVGFNNKYATEIFERFKRLNNTTQYRGAGLGLAISKKIVEIHGGSISAKSRENIGTIITLTLKC